MVDSNIESPAGRCPTAAHLGLRVYNTGVTPLTGVTLRIGDLLNPATFSGTAGVYPVTSVAPGLRGYSGDFAFVHEGGVADATRYIPSIPAGGSAVVYWLVSYPVKDLNGKTVAGDANVVEDDLLLGYDMWGEGYENVATLRRVYAERHMTCRNELSAMAVKAIRVQALSLQMETLLLEFNTEVGRDYVIKVSTDLRSWRTEYGSLLTAKGWSDYTDAPFTSGGPTARVRVPVHGRKHAFFKIEHAAN